MSKPSPLAQHLFDAIRRRVANPSLTAEPYASPQKFSEWQALPPSVPARGLPRALSHTLEKELGGTAIAKGAEGALDQRSKYLAFGRRPDQQALRAFYLHTAPVYQLTHRETGVQHLLHGMVFQALEPQLLKSFDAQFYAALPPTLSCRTLIDAARNNYLKLSLPLKLGLRVRHQSDADCAYSVALADFVPQEEEQIPGFFFLRDTSYSSLPGYSHLATLQRELPPEPTEPLASFVQRRLKRVRNPAQAKAFDDELRQEVISPLLLAYQTLFRRGVGVEIHGQNVLISTTGKPGLRFYYRDLENTVCYLPHREKRGLPLPAKRFLKMFQRNRLRDNLDIVSNVFFKALFVEPMKSHPVFRAQQSYFRWFEKERSQLLRMRVP